MPLTLGRQQYVCFFFFSYAVALSHWEMFEASSQSMVPNVLVVVKTFIRCIGEGELLLDFEEDISKGKKIKMIHKGDESIRSSPTMSESARTAMQLLRSLEKLIPPT